MLRFAGYGGVRLERQAIGAMFASGAIAGLVGAIIVLGSQFRFIDGALLSPAYTWSGLMAALLADGEPVGAILAGLFFAALQTGGFAMQRETSVPRVLTLVLQSIVILFLAVRHGVGRRAVMSGLFTPVPVRSRRCRRSRRSCSRRSPARFAGGPASSTWRWRARCWSARSRPIVGSYFTA